MKYYQIIVLAAIIGSCLSRIQTNTNHNKEQLIRPQTSLSEIVSRLIRHHALERDPIPGIPTPVDDSLPILVQEPNEPSLEMAPVGAIGDVSSTLDSLSAMSPSLGDESFQNPDKSLTQFKISYAEFPLYRGEVADHYSATPPARHDETGTESTMDVEDSSIPNGDSRAPLGTPHLLKSQRDAMPLTVVESMGGFGGLGVPQGEIGILGKPRKEEAYLFL